MLAFDNKTKNITLTKLGSLTITAISAITQRPATLSYLGSL